MMVKIGFLHATLNKRGQYDPYKIYTSETIDLDYHAKYR